jgi:hypothetical protein
LEDVLAFDLSPDREEIAYIVVESPEEQPLYIGRADGGESRSLVNTATSGLGGLGSPVFTDDGATVVFAAHEESEAEGTRGHSLVAARLAAPMSHESASDIWSIPASGGEPALLAEVELTDPLFTIGSDSMTFYAISESLLEIGDDSATRMLAENALYGRPAFIEN